MNRSNHIIVMRLFVGIFLATFFCFQSTAQNCAGWGNGVDSIKVRRNYDEYQKLLEKGDYTSIEFFWSNVYRNAPGASKNVYLDGVKIYKHLYENEKNPSLKKKHFAKIVEIFDQRINCFPEERLNVLARKALELQKLDADLEISYQAFKIALDENGNQMPSFAILPCVEVVTQYYLEGGITDAEKDKIYHQIESITSVNILQQNDKDNYHAAWVLTKKKFNEADITPSQNYGNLANTNKDCYSITKAYKLKISNEPNNENLMMKAINELRGLDCDEASKYTMVLLGIQENLLKDKIDGGLAMVKSGSTLENANFAYKNGDYTKSIELYQNAISETSDISKKATLTYQIAKIYYSKLDDKSMAAKQLLEVLAYDANYGNAYLLLGDVYYAAAKECFPTDEFDQKMVIYLSIEKWEKAKALDPSLSVEVNERINKYSPYLPSKSELFLARSRFKNNTYKIGCWINEKVKVNL